MLKRNVQDFWRRFVMVDETGIHHYTPETNQQSKHSVVPGECEPKKAKTVSSARKVMATVFWDAKRIILIDYLRKGQIITGKYYATLLSRLHGKLQTERPNLAHKKILFHRDHASTYTFAVLMAKLHELEFKRFHHIPYSPDLASSDFFLFPNLKIWLVGNRFPSDKEVIAAVNEYFKGLKISYFSEGIKKSEER